MTQKDSACPNRATTAFRAGVDLFLVSVLVLFLELACIRWFAAHVLFLTFFTNTVLLACFLGMSVGCLAAARKQNFILLTPLLLSLALGIASAIERYRNHLEKVLRVGNQASPQLVYFGTEYHAQDPARFVIPIEFVAGFFFLAIALAMIGPGQELGRALNRIPNRIQAYTVNILGSILGVMLFAGCALGYLSPFWWFLLIIAGIGYFIFRVPARWPALRWGLLAALVAVLALASVNTGTVKSKTGKVLVEHLWSPYYRIDFTHPRWIWVNQLSHQSMVSRDSDSDPAHAYELPHLLQRDSGGAPFQEVLIIGAGTGNDVSRALQWGARHVDAVEIDPLIARIGANYAPDHPYQDPRVTVHLGDGRNFLRASTRQYDLIVYALVDSLVLHSSYSNIRLESFLFTNEAFADVRRHLRPNGVFAMYNYFRQGWVVARLDHGLAAVFHQAPLLLTLPYQATIEPGPNDGFTMFLAGDIAHFRDAFQRHPAYWLRGDRASGPNSPNGFEVEPQDPSNYEHFGPARLVDVQDLRPASDDWPFLYLRTPMIPSLSKHGILIMGALALLLIALFVPKERTEGKSRIGLAVRMFFLGAGFMLIETEAVVHMALLFGGTWLVNTVVFFSVLVMILLANLYVLKVKPQRLWPYYAGLLAVLALNLAIPLDFFLGMSRGLQVAGSCLLVFAPMLFAGVIFAVSFGRSAHPDHDFGANIAGAVLGGLAEYSSMLLGFQHLVVLTAAFYVLSGLLGRSSGNAEELTGAKLKLLGPAAALSHHW